MEKGLLQVYTGNGKGKTTAAMGLAIRAVGQGLRVHIIQFLKQGIDYGEVKSFAKIEGITIESYGGPGFIFRDGVKEEDLQLAEKAIAKAKELVTAGKCDLLILDEINNALQVGVISREQLEEILNLRPDTMELVLTGRNAPQFLIDRADLVTEMKEIKHPFKNGQKSRRGIEY
ncbi:cob(I)alamin adenosyltransferase [Desulfitispora alkaliphila]|uniref:cob(I)yrinic acid a,c-diamide adenosyltransferase n=1 Tax=Desulfitispora alkaliphila TaxID=622674 RepID=UPI003D24FF07